MTLTRRTPLRSRTPLQCRTPLKPISKKRKSLLPLYRKVKEQVFARDHGVCQARETWPEIQCTPWILDPHHIEGRIGDRFTDPDKIITLCRAHHEAVGKHPALARERGLLR